MKLHLIRNRKLQIFAIIFAILIEELNYRRLGKLTKSEKLFGVELDNLKRLETVNDFADFFKYSLYCQRLTKFG